jgi:hypothetical protein
MANSSRQSKTRALGGDFRLERFRMRIVLGRALQETRALAADCNSRGFGRLVGKDPSSFDFCARAICPRVDARLKA